MKVGRIFVEAYFKQGLAVRCPLLMTCSKRWFGQPAAQTHPHLIKEGEVTPGITKEEYKRRRDNLAALALQSDSSKNHIMLIPSATKQFMSNVIPYPFHQNTDFLYLCGFLEPDSLLVMQFNSRHSPVSTLFVPKRDVHKEKWDGPRSGVDGTIQLTGVDSAYNNDEIVNFLTGFLCDSPDFVLWYNEKTVVNPSIQDGAIRSFIQQDKHSKIESLSPYLQALRVFKSPVEVDLMRKACSITGEAFKEVMKSSYPGINEHYLYAKIDYECRVRDAQILAYPPVVAGGNRANIIHYVNNNKIIHDGELVLMDAGCEYNGYVSDITRTWPVSGEFSPAQRCLYNVILDIQKKCIDLCVPGQTMDSIYSFMLQLLGEALKELGIFSRDCKHVKSKTSSLCPHHVSHYLGMDVHDTPNVSTGEKLQPGMVVTIEPGIYLSEDNTDIPAEFRGIGIRIEDNVLITKSDPDVLSNSIPKEAEDIEKLMAKS